MLKGCVTRVAVVAIIASIGAGQSSEAVPERVSYGTAETSFGELFVPRGSGPFPVAVLLHGGCWLSTRSSLADMRAMATMLANHGIASWNIEYRRVGHVGGGWPGTFRDVSDGTDFVRELARTHPLDPARVMAVGHSSGGYFAAWIAGRRQLSAGSPLVGSSPLKLAGLVLLDAFLDPRVIDSRGVDGRLFCDQPILPRLIGGDPESVALLPFGVPQAYVVSSLRYPVTPTRPLAGGRTTLAVLDYPALAQEAGDSVSVQIVSNADHFDFLKPATNAWAAVEPAIVKMFGLH
jgi:acetyl esterase/lipase